MDAEVRCALSQVQSISGLLVLAVVQGMAFGWKAAVQTKLEESPFDLTTEDNAWVLSLFDMGVLGGVLLGTGAFLRTGSRRKTLLLAPPFYLAWVIVTYAATHPWHLMVARLLSGVGHGVLLLYMPIYIGEVATPRLRGVLVMLAGLLSALGGLASYCIAPDLSLSVHALLPLPLLGVGLALLVFTMHESPYGLAWQGRHNTMWDTLRRVRRGRSEDAIRREAEAVRGHISQQKRQAPTWRQTFSPPGTILAAFVVVVLSGTTELIGVYTLIGTRDYFFNESGRPMEYFQFNLMFISLMAGGMLVAVVLVETIGRRCQYGIATFINFIAFAGLSGYYLVKEYLHSVDYTAIRWIPFASLIVFITGTGIGVLNVPQVVMSELLTERAKVVVVLGAGLLVSISSFLINRLFLLVCTDQGFTVAFILYTIANLLNVMFAYNPMPETKGMSLMEIQSMLAEKEKDFVILTIFRKIYLRLRPRRGSI